MRKLRYEEAGELLLTYSGLAYPGTVAEPGTDQPGQGEKILYLPRHQPVIVQSRPEFLPLV